MSPLVACLCGERFPRWRLRTHEKFRCTAAGALASVLSVPLPPPAQASDVPVCGLDGCGKPARQVNRWRKKRFCSQACYEKERHQRRKVGGARREALVPPPGRDEQDAREMAAIRNEQARLRSELARTEVVVLASRWPWPGMLELLAPSPQFHPSQEHP